MNLNDLFTEEKVRLDPKCWTGKKIGNPKTKMKGGTRVNNCVPAESVNEMDKSQTPPGRDGSNDSDAGKKEYTAKATTAKKVAKDAEKILNKELNKKQGVAEGALSEKINPKTLTRGFVQEKDMGWYTLQAVGDFASRMADEPPTMEIYAMLKPEAGKRDGKQIGQLSLKIAQGRFLKDNPGAEALVAGGVDVDAAYQRKGVASAMYQFAKELGNDVIASIDQSDDAVAMWKGMQAKGVAEEYELAGVGVAYELGRRAYKQGMTIRDNPYSATREARKNDEWAKGLERGKHDANDARHFRSSVREQGVAEKLGDNRPKLGSKRDAGKSVRKWRKSRGLDETDQVNEKSVSQAQFRTMAAAAHNPEFAKKVGIKQSVAKEFNQADKGNNYKKLPDRTTEGELDEGWKSALGAAAIAGTMAMGGGAHARVSGDYVDNPEINRLTGQPKVTQQISPDAAKPAATKPGFSKEYLQSVVDGTHPRPLISKERAQELLQQQTTNEQGEQQNGADYRDPPEADYGDDYQDMVARVKKLAGLGPLKTVYDPTKRVYRNVPTAVQPKK